MTGYMVSTYWCGALNISNMRLFDNEIDAKAYITSVLQQKYKTQNVYTPFIAGAMRLYKLSDNAKPVKMPFP